MNRRQFNKIAAAWVGQIALAAGPFGALIRRGWAGIQKRVLDADTKLFSLLFENPAHLDPKNVPITPIDKFGTMGLTEYDVDLEKWPSSSARLIAPSLISLSSGSLSSGLGIRHPTPTASPVVISGGPSPLHFAGHGAARFRRSWVCTDIGSI